MRRRPPATGTLGPWLVLAFVMGCVSESGEQAEGVTTVVACPVTDTSRNLVFFGPATSGTVGCGDGTVAAEARVQTMVRYCMDEETIADFESRLDLWRQTMAFRVTGGLTFEAGAQVRVSCTARYVDLGPADVGDPPACQAARCCEAVHCVSADVEVLAR